MGESIALRKGTQKQFRILSYIHFGTLSQIAGCVRYACKLDWANHST